MALSFALLVGAMVLFALEIYPIDFVALAILASLLVLAPVLGLAPSEVISGFSNPAAITVLAMFILSGGIERTGVIDRLSRRVASLAGPGEVRQLLTVSLVAAPLSMVINNTAVVALLMPMVTRLSHEKGVSVSKLLLPLSYVAQLAGVVTLIGTSTNILGSALAEENGIGAFGIFEFSKIGLAVLGIGVLYLVLFGRRLIPARRPFDEEADAEILHGYVSEVVVLEESPHAGRSLQDTGLGKSGGVRVLEIVRDGQRLAPRSWRQLRALDILVVAAPREDVLRLRATAGFALEADAHWKSDAEGGEATVLEVVLGPNSDLVGTTLREAEFYQRFGCPVLAIRQHGRVLRERLATVPLRFGDTLLLRVPQEYLARIRRVPGFIVTGAVEAAGFRASKAPVAIGIVLAVVAFAALGAPILVTSMAGAALMVVTGCLRMDEVHAAVRWDVILLLAGVIPLGLGLERTGGAQLLANLVTRLGAFLPGVLVLAVFYVATMVLTELVSNNTAVVVMVPVGIHVARSLGLDPKAFVLAIMFAASTSFSTPVGYQTNALVYGPGGYKFTDFLRVGGPLNILLAIVTPLLIAFLWGL